MQAAPAFFDTKPDAHIAQTVLLFVQRLQFATLHATAAEVWTGKIEVIRGYIEIETVMSVVLSRFPIARLLNQGSGMVLVTYDT